LQAEAEDHAKFVVTSIAPAYLPPAMKINLVRNKPNQNLGGASGSSDFWHLAKLDLETELGDLGGQAPGFDVGGAAIEVVRTEIVVFGTIFQHVVDCGEHRSGHGADCFLRAMPAAQAVELRLVVAVLLASGRPAS
jgi:hypothetical protein